MWLIGAMVCLLAAPWIQLSVSAGNGWPHNALRHHWLMPISCHVRDCKALLVTSLTHVRVSGAIASVQTFSFTFICLASSSSFLACNSRLRSAIRRHRPPQRAVLSQICCFGERKMVMFQILMDGAEPRDAGTTQLSSPVCRRGGQQDPLWHLRCRPCA